MLIYIDYLKLIGFKNCPVYSTFEDSYVGVKGEPIEFLKLLVPFSTSLAYLAIHTYTLTLVAVSKLPRLIKLDLYDFQFFFSNLLSNCLHIIHILLSVI